MGFVALVALNLGAVKAVLGRNDRFNEHWLMAALPMANALIVVPLIGDRRRGRGLRPFRMGFQAFGAMALSLYFNGKWLYPDMTGFHFLLFTQPLGLSLTDFDLVLLDCVPLVAVSLTQFLFALFGGWLFHAITRFFRF
jgi:hypothetical protein